MGLGFWASAKQERNRKNHPVTGLLMDLHAYLGSLGFSVSLEVHG